MRDSVRQTVGSIAISWNEADELVAQIAILYLDLDQVAYDILIKTMRPTDREDLLRKVVKAKEYNADIVAEVADALANTQACRENRNIILHHLGSIGGELTEQTERLLERVLADLTATSLHLRNLHVSIRSVVLDRLGREMPSFDGETGKDELVPLVSFTPPLRPSKPRRIKLENLKAVEE